MTLDPYRTLGLQPGASAAEVKRAYRRLAKAFHPDSAGESALPRFLAIHEAYEAIRTGRPMGGTRAGVRPADRAGGQPAAEPWRADPARARAARERARTARAGRGAGSARGSWAESGPASAGGSARPSGARRGEAGKEQARDGQGGPAASAARGSSGTSGTSGTSSPRGRRSATRKATLGSTSYDEARDPRDASWSGASWYGPTSGEYWIINPREYADPRKHGPEYQSRARRTSADPSISGTAEDEAPFVSTPAEEPGLAGNSAGDAAGPAEPEAVTSRRAFETRTAAADPSRGRTRAERVTRAAQATRAHDAAGSTGMPGDLGAARLRAARPGPGAGTDANPGLGRGTSTPRRDHLGTRRDAPARPLEEAARDWLGGSRDDPVRRLGVALVAWPPVGLAAAAAIGDLTGCSRFAATCTDTGALLPWLAQAGILGLLLLLPALARLLAAGTIGVLLGLVPITAFLLVVGGAGQPEAGFALAFLLGIAWILGVAGALLSTLRRNLPNRAGGAT